MSKKDQEIREKLIQSNYDKIIADEVQKIDAQHNEALRKIISSYGWPSIHEIGEEASIAFFVLIIHQDDNLDFQQYCLTLLETAAQEGNARLRDYAQLQDRILCNQSKEQRYGTQYIIKDGQFIMRPLENPDQLAERREQVGLPSIEEQEQEMKRFREKRKMGA